MREEEGGGRKKEREEKRIWEKKEREKGRKMMYERNSTTDTLSLGFQINQGIRLQATAPPSFLQLLPTSLPPGASHPHPTYPHHTLLRQTRVVNHPC